jgi:hypothetical protein
LRAALVWPLRELEDLVDLELEGLVDVDLVDLELEDLVDAARAGLGVCGLGEV